MLSVLFTPGVREQLSKVRVPRALSGVPGHGVFGQRPSVYLPLSFTRHAVIFLRSAIRQKREITIEQGTVEAGFEPADAYFPYAAKPFSFFRLLLMSFQDTVSDSCGTLTRGVPDRNRALLMELINPDKLLSVSFPRCRGFRPPRPPDADAAGIRSGSLWASFRFNHGARTSMTL